jgi:hypothetical protein
MQEQTAIEAVARRFSAHGKRAVIPPTPISWSLENGLLSTSNPSTGAALAAVTAPSLV